MNSVEEIAFLAEVKVEAVITLVSYILNRDLPASIAFDDLLHRLARLNYDLNLMRI